jgi:hypothetical protein
MTFLLISISHHNHTSELFLFMFACRLSLSLLACRGIPAIFFIVFVVFPKQHHQYEQMPDVGNKLSLEF